MHHVCVCVCLGVGVFIYCHKYTQCVSSGLYKCMDIQSLLFIK